MKSINTQELLSQLQQQVMQARKKVAQVWTQLPDELLNQEPQPGAWSAAQAIDHLNMYGRYYLPALEEAIKKGLRQHVHASDVYVPGWLGDYFTLLMEPRGDGTVKSKMKAMKGYTPKPALDAGAVLAEFISQQEQFQELLQQAARVHVGKLRVATSLSSLIRLKLGDTFRFIIAHQNRHLLQAERAIEAAKTRVEPALQAIPSAGRV